MHILADKGITALRLACSPSSALADLGAKMNDVVKVNAFYRSGGTAEDLNANLAIRSSCFTAPGPTTTGIPVPALAVDGVTISVDVLAMLE